MSKKVKFKKPQLGDEVEIEVSYTKDKNGDRVWTSLKDLKNYAFDHKLLEKLTKKEKA